jgi:hypothetical protein
MMPRGSSRMQPGHTSRGSAALRLTSSSTGVRHDLCTTCADGMRNTRPRSVHERSSTNTCGSSASCPGPPAVEPVAIELVESVHEADGRDRHLFIPFAEGIVADFAIQLLTHLVAEQLPHAQVRHFQWRSWARRISSSASSLDPAVTVSNPPKYHVRRVRFMPRSSSACANGGRLGSRERDTQHRCG